MRLTKNNKEVDYEELDINISKHFKVPHNKDSFCVIPNKNGIFNTIDWYSMLVQADHSSFNNIIEYYKNDFKSTLIDEEGKEVVTLKELIPQLYNLIEFLITNKYQVSK